MARFLLKRWEAKLDGVGISRRDRRGCEYEAYLPDGLRGRSFQFDGTTAADVADAERAIAALDHSAIALADTEALARLLLRAESVASSRIEGLEVGPRRLLRADAARERGESVTDVTASEVLANIDAMTYAMKAVRGDEVITCAQLLEMHGRLFAGTRLAKHAGRVRTVQNWIGGSSYNPCSASFVPPPPELVNDLLSDLCEFCNDDALPAVAQAAIAHAQFETVHPFVDGNGRIGRALIHMVLRKRGLAKRVLAPVSLVLATRSSEYIRALTATRYRGNAGSDEATRGVNGWISLFAAACVRAVSDAEFFERRIVQLQREWHDRLGPVRSHSVVHRLLEALPGAPFLSVKGAATLTKRSVPAVNDAVNRFVEAGILRPTNARSRDRTFEAREIIEAFVDLERGLASPSGDTRIEAPVRAVPRLPGRGH
jgi:Fic family protein